MRPTRKKTSRRRWVFRILLALVALGAGAWAVVHYVVLPRVIRGQVEQALRGLGIESPEFELRDAGLFGTELRNVSAGGEAGSGLRIGAVSIAYGPVDATSGQIESVTLRGAELFATLEGGRLDLGPFTLRPAADAADDGKPLDLPFKRLRLESSTLRLDWEGQQWWLPVSGVVTNAGGGRLTLDARTFAAGSPVTLAATYHPASGETTADLEAPGVNLASLMSAVPPRLLPQRVRAGGRASATVTLRDVRGRRTVSARIEPRDAWLEAAIDGRRVEAEGITLRADAALDAASGRPTGVSVAGDIGSVTAAGYTARDVRLDVQPHGDALAFTLTAAGDGWRLARLEGEARGLLPAEPAQDSTAAAARTQPVALQTPPTAASHPAGEAPVTVTASYQLTGSLPRAVLDLLSARGLDVSQIGELEVEGEADAFVHLGPPPPGRDRWRVETDTTQVSLAPGDLATAGGATRVRALAASLKLHATVGPREAVVRLLDDSWVDWQAIVGGSKESTFVGGDVRLGVLPAEGHAPALRVRFTHAGPDVTSALRLRTDAPVSVTAGGVDVRVARVEWSGKAVVPSVGPFSLDGTLGIAGGSVAHAASKAAVGRVDATVPVTINWDAAEPGRVSLAEISVDGQALPPVNGSLALPVPRATFDLAWAPLPDAEVTASGSVELAAGGLVGDANLLLKPFELTDGAALGKLLPALAGVDVTGTVGASGHVTLNRGRVEPRAEVTLAGVAVRDEAGGASIEGVSGSVAVESFSPFTTAGGQRLVASKLTQGKLALTDGAVEFRVEGPNSILIEQTNWGWAGGRVYSHAFRVDPSKPNVDVVLYADGLRVRELLSLVAEDRATGEGVLYGRIPVTVRWPRVTFGDGFLYARPGTPGELKFLDAQTAGALLDQADPRFRQDANFAQVKQRVIDALRDFEYDLLRLDLENDPAKGNQLVARVHVHGKGRRGPRPQELDLTFNFRGLEELLNGYLGLQEKLSDAGVEVGK